MAGVQNFLECPEPPKRHCGLVVAEVLSRLLQPQSPVEFEELRDTEISRCLADVRKLSPFCQYKNSFQIEESSVKSSLVKYSLEKIPKIPNKYEEHFASVDYSGLEPGEPLLATSPLLPPVHVHEALALLRQSDSADAIVAALEALPGLLRSPAALLGLTAETAAECAALLATLNDSFDTAGFAERRSAALTLLAERFPRAVVPELATRLLADRYSIAEKTTWLQLLRTIAETIAASPQASGLAIQWPPPSGGSRLLLPGTERFGDSGNPLRPRVRLAPEAMQQRCYSAVELKHLTSTAAAKPSLRPGSLAENRFSAVAHLFFNPTLLCLRTLGKQGALLRESPAYLSTALVGGLLESLWRFAELCGGAGMRRLMARDIIGEVYGLLPSRAGLQRLPPLLRRQFLRVLAAIAGHKHCCEVLRDAEGPTLVRLAGFVEEIVLYGEDVLERAAALCVRDAMEPAKLNLVLPDSCKLFLPWFLGFLRRPFRFCINERF